MPQMHVNAQITPGDMDAAYNFIGKRVKRRGPDEILEAISAALLSVMYATGEGLVESGLPVSEVEKLFEQFKAQVAFQLHVLAARSAPTPES